MDKRDRDVLFLIGYTVADEDEIRAVGGGEYDINHPRRGAAGREAAAAE